MGWDTYTKEITIAEACGWRHVKDVREEGGEGITAAFPVITGVPPGVISGLVNDGRERIPSYTTDLAAAHGAVRALVIEERLQNNFVILLGRVRGVEIPNIDAPEADLYLTLLLAEPHQLVDALLQTLES
jgi:hypothetical protein